MKQHVVQSDILIKGQQKNLFKNDHQHHTVPYSNLLHHVNNPRPVSTLMSLIRCVQKTLNNKHAEKTNCHWVQKNAIQNNMIQQYLYHGGPIQGHTHMARTTSHISEP